MPIALDDSTFHKVTGEPSINLGAENDAVFLQVFWS